MKINNLASQKALTYCIYMMVSGNFAGLRVVTPCMEQKLLLSLKGQKEKDQERYEDAAAQLSDKFFLRKLPKNIWEEQPRVAFTTNENTGVTEIVFLGKKWTLKVVGLTRGKKKPQFFYSFTEKVSVKKPEKKSERNQAKAKAA